MSQLTRFLRLFSIFSLVQSQTDNCPVIKCDKDPSGQNGCIYTGMIKPDQLNTAHGAPILAGESERDAISVMVGCYFENNTSSDGNFPTDLIIHTFTLGRIFGICTKNTHGTIYVPKKYFIFFYRLLMPLTHFFFIIFEISLREKVLLTTFQGL